MKLFLISQEQNRTYDTYDSAVVSAENEQAARIMPPDGDPKFDWGYKYSTWCSSPDHVTVEYIGEYAGNVSRVICASFNAG